MEDLTKKSKKKRAKSIKIMKKTKLIHKSAKTEISHEKYLDEVIIAYEITKLSHMKSLD